MSCSRASLQTIDINVLPVPSKCLRKPRAVSGEGHFPSAALGRPIASPLSLDDLCRRVREALLGAELLRGGGAEDRRALLHAELERLLSATAAEARAGLVAAFASWGAAEAPLSYRALEVARHRRRALCAGQHRTMGDLKEWMRLAVLLGEPQLQQRTRWYAQRLSPRAQQVVEDAALVHAGNDAAFARALQETRATEEGATPFDARYFAFALDGLIAMADAAPVPVTAAQSQGDVTAQMRELLSEWLMQVSLAVNVHMETFFLALVILDRYMDCVAVSRGDLHRIGCAALLLASKQEEVLSIPLRALLRYGGERFTVDELVATECQMFAVLQFNVVCATLHAVGTGLAMDQEPVACNRQRSFLLYTLATLAIRTRHGQFRLSALAAAAVYLSRVCFCISTGEPAAEVRELVPVVLAALRRNVPTGGVYSVFSRGVFHEVSKVPLPDTV